MLPKSHISPHWAVLGPLCCALTLQQGHPGGARGQSVLQTCRFTVGCKKCTPLARKTHLNSHQSPNSNGPNQKQSSKEMSQFALQRKLPSQGFGNKTDRSYLGCPAAKVTISFCWPKDKKIRPGHCWDEKHGQRNRRGTES